MDQIQPPKNPTPTVTLRPCRPSDLDALVAWAWDPRILQFLRRGPLANSDEARHYLTTHILPHPYCRAICVDDRPVGMIKVNPGPAHEPFKASVGYSLAYDYWGRGIATVVLKMVVGDVFKSWAHLVRLEAIADVENPASQRVLEKAGFKREGVLRKFVMLKGEYRDMVMFSYLASDDPIIYDN
ncbi:uncharacterized protein [Typha latifolia]|uniref:uncharacterized protein n=1 Tax=Typha latifolia TaxID=4733 RepID=UPI003C2C7A1A